MKKQMIVLDVLQYVLNGMSIVCSIAFIYEYNTKDFLMLLKIAFAATIALATIRIMLGLKYNKKRYDSVFHVEMSKRKKIDFFIWVCLAVYIAVAIRASKMVIDTFIILCLAIIILLAIVDSLISDKRD